MNPRLLNRLRFIVCEECALGRELSADGRWHPNLSGAFTVPCQCKPELIALVEELEQREGKAS